MKRTLLAKRNALLSGASFSWGTGALIVAVLLLLVRLIAPNFFWYACAPAFRASDALAQDSHAFLSGFNTASALTLQNEALFKEDAALTAQNESLLDEVGAISGLAAAPKSIIAGVVARPPESPYDTIVVAAGSAEGVTVGQEAFAEGGVPCGTVTSAIAHFSRITLFSSPGTTLQAWVGSEHIPLVIQGSGAGTFTASADRSAGIAVGDSVFVAGPGGQVIGTIERVDSAPSSPSVTLQISPAFNLFATEWVALRDTGIALLTPSSSTTTPPLQ
jgi:cell shape-determining protein MreC